MIKASPNLFNRQKPISRLRATACHWLGVNVDDAIEVMYFWRDQDDDTRKVRLQVRDGAVTKRITLTQTQLGAWTPLAY